MRLKAILSMVLLVLVAACGGGQKKDPAGDGAKAPVTVTGEVETNPGSCEVDADCRAHSDYCGGCNCLALDKDETAPVCKATMVQCLVDPCGAKQAVCNAGACELVAK